MSPPPPSKVQVLVLGGGPGGYVAAIRAGQLGLDTVLVEVDRLGGTCLIRGCIPSKALIHAAGEFEILRRAQGANPLGLRVAGEIGVDFAQTQRWKEGIVDRLSDGVGGLLRRAKVRVVRGRGVFSDARTCEITRADGVVEVLEAEHVILAAGSEAAAVPALPFGGDVLSSTEALVLSALPATLAVIGAGYIGLELGMAFAALGVKVSVVEAQPRILPQYDAALSAPVVRALERAGIDVHLDARATGFEAGRLAVARAQGAGLQIPAEKVLVTVGRRPRTDGWGLEKMAVDLDGPFIKVDDRCHTSMRNVWAIGDLVGEPMLAHKASAQGEMVAEIIAGRRRRFDPVAIPAVCFTTPEVVSVGVWPEPGPKVITAVFPLAANGRALSQEAGDDGGFIRVAARADDHRILAFAAVGRHVSELSAEMTALLEMGAVLEDAAGLIHVHPTQSEAIGEAALRALGHAIHV
jgi:dihydrolipoamide dehydrogenase